MKPNNPGQLLKQWKGRVPYFALLLLCLASIPYLTRPPWFDEVLTLGWLTVGFSRIPFTYPIPNNHIVYTMLLSAWEAAGREWCTNWILLLRLLSLLIGGAAIWILGKECIRSCGTIPGTLCTLLLAVSGPMTLFSTALRGYGAALLFSLAAFVAAERWMRGKICRPEGGLYLLFSLLAVGVMPTALFALLGGALFFLPEIRKKEKRLQWVLLAGIPIVSVPLFYAHIFRKLVAASQLREGWTGYGSAYWNVYGSFAFVFLPLLPAALAGGIRLWRRSKGMRIRLAVILLVYALPLAFLIPARVPPFPRIFFPFFGIWTILLGMLVRAYLHSAGRSGKILLLGGVFAWMLITPALTPAASRILFGPPGSDDLLCAYPVSEEFMPAAAAETIRKEIGEEGTVFIDFDADPPSLRILLLNSGVPEERVLYDRPDYGRVVRLPPNCLLVCRSREDLEKLKRRFSLTGDFEPLLERGMQKVYRPK